MKIFVVLFILSQSIYGDILDQYYIYKANNYVQNKEYKNAIISYEKIEEKTDSIKYNLGGLYYKIGEYQKAKDYYLQIDGSSLEFKKFHNLGNCDLKLNQLEEAKIAYQKALTFKNDPDTQNNLLLLEKQIELKKKRLLQNKKRKKGDKFEGISDFEDESVSKEGTKTKNEKNKISKNERTTATTQREKEKIEAKTKKEEMKIKWSKGDIVKYNNQKTMQKLEKEIVNRKLNTLLIPLNDEGEGYGQIEKPW